MVSPVIKQSWTVLGPLLCQFAAGFMMTYPACLLPALMAEDSPIKVDRSTASWIASSVVIGGWFGIIGGAYLIDKLGRKLSHILFIIPCILGWLLIYFATNVTMLIIGRVATGFSVFATYNIGLCVVSEYTSPEVRGLVFSLKTLFFTTSIFLTHILGIYFHWRIIALIGTMPMLVSLAITCTWTESPAWLLLKGDYKKSEETFYWLRGTSDRSVREFQAMAQAQRERKENTQKPKNLKDQFLFICSFFTNKDFLKPMILYIFLFVCLEASGRHFIPAFSTTIMAEIIPEKMDVSVYILSFDIISLLGNAISCLIIKNLNRRTILLLSGSLSVVSLSVFSLYGYLIYLDSMTSRPWLLVSILIGYVTFANVGIATLPLIINGEIFPLAIRGTSIAISNFIALFLLFLVFKVILILFNLLTVFGTFALIAVLLLVSLIYLYYNLPETRNKSMQEIEDYFHYGRSINREFIKGTDPEAEAMVCSDTLNKL